MVILLLTEGLEDRIGVGLAFIQPTRWSLPHIEDSKRFQLQIWEKISLIDSHNRQVEAKFLNFA